MNGPTIRQIAFLNGVLAAQEGEHHPDAIAETRRAVTSDMTLRCPGAPPARLGRTNGGLWLTVDAGDWGRAVSVVHHDTDSLDRTLELVMFAMRAGGDLNLTALTEGLRMAPIVVTNIEDATHRAAEVADIAAWYAYVSEIDR